MPRQELCVLVPDLSGFVRAIGRAAQAHGAEHGTPPTHNQWLNIVARALGYRNHQSLRAAALRSHPPGAADVALPPIGAPAAPRRGSPPAPRDDPSSVPAPAAAPATALSANARKALTQFDDQGRLLRWPVKFSVQRLAMWVLWTRFEAKRPYTEREVNAILRQANGFGDHVTLRRELINHRLLTRKSDCSEYRKLPARPDDETRALLTAARARFRAARAPRRDAGRRVMNPD